ncbi:MAG: redoxin domain-containing protein [Sphingobacteriales bacterium JAD_PAG50586_3]|nr:MAG: redoxin domain-containing protein [Sphingobacteriales bacterium JAD_PAG50586_3]
MPNNTLLKYALALVILASALQTEGQQTVIKGTAPSFKKAQLQLCTIDDYINGHELVLDSAVVDDKGNFGFKTTINQTIYSYIKQGDLLYDLYIEPTKNLDITIPDTIGFAKDSVLKPIVFIQPSALNADITQFDADYNDFLIANYKAILRRTAKPQTKVFIKAQQDKYAAITNSYFNQYLFYRLGSLELLAGTKSRKEVLGFYVKDKPILYNNTAYMGLFNELFEENLKVFRSTGAGDALTSAINDRIDYAKAMGIMQRDSTLTNDTLRELALLKGLGEMYYEPNAVQYSVLEMLRHIATNGLTAYNKGVAKNAVAQLEKLRTGTPAPAFTLKDIVSGKMVSLADFKGKYIYLSFWDEGNPRSVQEIDLIRELDKKYGRKIAFVSICTSVNETRTLSIYQPE